MMKTFIIGDINFFKDKIYFDHCRVIPGFWISPSPLTLLSRIFFYDKSIFKKGGENSI